MTGQGPQKGAGRGSLPTDISHHSTSTITRNKQQHTHTIVQLFHHISNRTGGDWRQQKRGRARRATHLLRRFNGRQRDEVVCHGIHDCGRKASGSVEDHQGIRLVCQNRTNGLDCRDYYLNTITGLLYLIWQPSRGEAAQGGRHQTETNLC